MDVAKVGLGLMGFTWNADTKFTQEQFDEVLKGAIEASDKPLFLNGGEFYGIPDRHENIKKLGQFFAKHPQYADRVVLSVKSGTDDHWGADVSPANLKKGIDAISEHLAPLYEARKKLPKALDYYTLARVGDAPIEDTVKELSKYVEAGKIDKICLSEVNGETLKKANEVYSIGAVEAEFSMWTLDSFKNGLLAAASQLKIPVVCYSPLGKGLLAGLDPSKLDKSDMRNNFDRFQGEAYEHNRQFVEKVSNIAKRLDIPQSKLLLSYITNLSGKTRWGFTSPQFVPIPGSTKLQRVLDNLAVVDLDEEVINELHDLSLGFQVSGSRYTKALDSTLSK